MTEHYHPRVKQLMDGELSLSELPPELRAEGEAALRWLATVDRTPIVLSSNLDERVMAKVRSRLPARTRVLDLRRRIRPWVLGAVAAAAAVLLMTLPRESRVRVPVGAIARAPVHVRFVLYAPGAGRVAVAGTFNQWNADAAPLAPTRRPGLWTATLPLSPGQHQYAFLVDGRHWVSDPTAPTVDDGFGRRNSVVAVNPQTERGRGL